jgi:hypothetical protein
LSSGSLSIDCTARSIKEAISGLSSCFLSSGSSDAPPSRAASISAPASSISDVSSSFLASCTVSNALAAASSRRRPSPAAFALCARSDWTTAAPPSRTASAASINMVLFMIERRP